MDHPALPPVAPGRSALPSFLAVEARLAAESEQEEAKARQQLEDARKEAERLRSVGEERLRQVVLDAEAEAKREAEARARDRISEARVGVQRWIEAAERAAHDAVAEALRVLVDGDPQAR